MTAVAARNLIRWVLAALGALFLAAKALDAGELPSAERRAQILGSDVIVVGTVVGLRSAWSPDHSVIVTDAEVALDEVWKGQPASDRVIVRTLGGSVGGVALEVDEAARFAVGERALLFLRAVGGAYAPWGMRLGSYEIVEENGVPFVVGASAGGFVAARSPGRTFLPLGDLRREVVRTATGRSG